MGANEHVGARGASDAPLGEKVIPPRAQVASSGRDPGKWLHREMLLANLARKVPLQTDRCKQIERKRKIVLDKLNLERQLRARKRER